MTYLVFFNGEAIPGANITTDALDVITTDSSDDITTD